MKIVHWPTLPELEMKSPSGRFHSYGRNISAALGARWRDQPGEPHPFDLQVRRVPVGAAICPYHLHAAQWEMFVVLAGRGTVRVNGGRYAVEVGEAFIHHPGTAHQTLNTGTTDLEVLIVADNPAVDLCYYPDSQKWAIAPLRRYFRIVELDYFDGEGEDVAGPGDRAPFAAPLLDTPLRKLRIDDLPWDSWQSPRGTFRGLSREVSIALGAKRNTHVDAGGHPFELELTKYPPGDSGCPFHLHAAQWEFYVIVRGRGIARTADARVDVGPGDAFVHPPGEAHQLINTGTEDLEFYVIADNPPADYWHYPDSGKWGTRAPRQFFRLAPAEYYDGEE